MDWLTFEIHFQDVQEMAPQISAESRADWLVYSKVETEIMCKQEWVCNMSAHVPILTQRHSLPLNFKVFARRS